MTDTKRRATEMDSLQPVNCISFRLRKAARSTARTYDNALRPVGLRNTQFSLLGALIVLGEISIGDLSQALAIDGTTLTRNLDILVRRRLVENIVGADARVRNIQLTDLGRETYEQALPLWRCAQKKVLAAFEPGQWDAMKAQLQRIEKACEGGG